MSENHSEIRKRVAIGAVWMVLLKVTVRGIGVLGTIILARLLLPEDYGLVAMATSFYALVGMFAAFGFDFALIQKQTITREDYDSAFTAKLICYTILALIICIAAHPVALFYSKPALTSILFALGLQMFLTGCENIALVDFRRDLLFDKEFKLQVMVKITGFFVTVYLAYTLRSYWALVIGSISLRLASIVYGYYLRPYTPSISFAKTKEIMSFSQWLLFMNFANYFRAQLPVMVLGKNISTQAVGIYTMGNEIGQTVSQEVVAAMNRPAYSGFSKLASKPLELEKNFLEVLGFQALIVLAMGFGLGSTAELVVQVALGSNWTNVAEPLIFLATGCAISALSSCCIYLYMAVNRPRLCFWFSISNLVVFTSLLTFLFEPYGLMGVVYAHFGACVFSAILSHLLAASVMSISIFKIWRVILRPLLGALIMFSCERTYIMPFAREEIGNIFAACGFAVACGGLIFTFTVLALWTIFGQRIDSPEAQLIKWARTKLAT